MWWLALQVDAAADAGAPNPQGPQQAVPILTALAWWALRFTPWVAYLEDAVVLEVSACQRLFGGHEALLQRVLATPPEVGLLRYGQGTSSLAALAFLRTQAQRHAPLPSRLPLAQLSLETLGAAQPHVPTLHRLGCRTWGDLQALPRGGVLRRFGQGLLDALDIAFGHAPDLYPWVQLPEVFDVTLELPGLVESAPGLMFAAQRLLGQLRLWLQARQWAVLALEWVWYLDERKLAQARSGQTLPDLDTLVLRTAHPSIDMGHLAQLSAEHWAQTTLHAPVHHVRLRSLETTALPNTSASLLPEDLKKGDSFVHLLERLTARLGAEQVLAPIACQDHRPERMQRWVPAQDLPKGTTKPLQKSTKAALIGPPDATLLPCWLLPQPLPLTVVGHRPYYQGVLRLRAGPQRLEAGWWQARASDNLALRDYFIASSPHAGLLWVYRERLQGTGEGAGAEALATGFKWYLHGLYG